jgi:hypothetical protein
VPSPPATPFREAAAGFIFGLPVMACPDQQWLELLIWSTVVSNQRLRNERARDEKLLRYIRQGLAAYKSEFPESERPEIVKRAIAELEALFQQFHLGLDPTSRE